MREDIKHSMPECQLEHSDFRKLRTVLNDALLLLVTPVTPPKVLITTVTTCSVTGQMRPLT